MLTLQTQLQPHSAVLSTVLSDAEIVLLHLHSNHYYTLNVTGAQVWQGLRQGHTPGEISQTLVDHYAVSPAEAEEAVLALLGALTAENLVQPAAEAVRQ